MRSFCLKAIQSFTLISFSHERPGKKSKAITKLHPQTAQHKEKDSTEQALKEIPKLNNTSAKKYILL